MVVAKPMSSAAACTLKIRGGCERDCYGKKAGKGALIQWEMSGTLGVSQDQTLFVWYTPSKGGQNIAGKTRREWLVGKRDVHA